METLAESNKTKQNAAPNNIFTIDGVRNIALSKFWIFFPKKLLFIIGMTNVKLKNKQLFSIILYFISINI